MEWDDDFEPTVEELQRKQEALNQPRGPRRSAADDILDAVSGEKTVAPRRVWECPKCRSDSDMRTPGVGGGVIMRKCRNAKCGNLWPQGMRQTPVEVDPVPPGPPALGPYYGMSGPPIDSNQPIHRRIAEYMRRARDNEP